MKQARILIVEDEAIVQLDLQQRLTRMGHTVAGISATGEDAVIKAAELTPDLVIMDVRLAGPMDGIEAARRIRAKLGTPILYVTAYATTLGDAARDLFGPCLSKPFSARDLSAAIAESLEQTGTTGQENPHPR